MAKAKGKTKAKPKAKAKPKPKAKIKSKAKPKAKAKPSLKAKPKSKAGNGIPITVMPGMCDDFTANTGDIVAWQQIPSIGCQILKGNTAWPFNVPHPINLLPVSNTQIKIALGKGVYQILVQCCTANAPKNVTVP